MIDITSTVELIHTTKDRIVWRSMVANIVIQGPTRRRGKQIEMTLRVFSGKSDDYIGDCLSLDIGELSAYKL